MPDKKDPDTIHMLREAVKRVRDVLSQYGTEARGHGDEDGGVAKSFFHGKASAYGEAVRLLDNILPDFPEPPEVRCPRCGEKAEASIVGEADVMFCANGKCPISGFCPEWFEKGGES